MKIFIEKKSYNSFISLRDLSGFQVASIILLIDHSTSKAADYIYLDKLHFLFDLLICDRTFNGFPKLTIPPWSIDKELKNKLIVLSRNEIVEQSNDSGKVRYSLTDKGRSKVESIRNIEELASIDSKARELALASSTKMFKNSKVIFPC
ncbi:hypothetical protein CWE14_08895 [Aliidiomarina soli]|uniref:HTH hxlR-type domain-containing protein n=1 Tax=Aliidiomarina soli TaxID=1928574 RepID=A0A432WHW0_9GAMM|nr:hypothetical protein CWE14_08895 [Aliidiomarina soli]